MFKFNSTNKENYILLELTGRLMIHEDAQTMQNQIINNLTENLNTVIISFNNLEYLNSSGLSALITILTKSRNLGGDSIITNIPPSIDKLLLISKLNTVFSIKSSIEEAVLSLNQVKN